MQYTIFFTQLTFVFLTHLRKPISLHVYMYVYGLSVPYSVYVFMQVCMYVCTSELRNLIFIRYNLSEQE